MSVSLIIAKIVVTVSAVLGLSLAAEHASPKAAGLLSGYPLGAAIILFFYGLEVGPGFAAESALYTLAGLIASQSFMYFYYKSSLYFKRLCIPLSTLTSLSGFFLVVWLLHFINLGKSSALAAAVTSIAIFLYLFKDVKDVEISTRIRLTHGIILARVILAASIIVAVIAAGTLVGPKWAGLFSAFPSTSLPLMLIIHFTYDKEHVHTIVKNVPRGLGAVIMYIVTVSFAYPAYGIYAGTALSFLMATVYMLGYFYAVTKLPAKLSLESRNVG